MNYVDAECMKCGEPMKWLSGTPRICATCRGWPDEVCDYCGTPTWPEQECVCEVCRCITEEVL